MVRTGTATLVACALLPPASVADPVSDVRCAEIRFSRAVEDGELEVFRSMLDPDARFAGEQVLRGPEAIAAAWTPFFSPGGPRIAWRPRIVEVLESGDLALTRGPYRLETRGESGEPTVRWGTFNSVWRRGADGNWRVVFDAGGPPMASATEESEALLAAPTEDCEPEVARPGTPPQE